MVKTTKIVTPIGTAAWCAINPDSPDTKFEPQWYVDLIVEKDAEGMPEFGKAVKAFYEETRQEFGMERGTNPIPIKAYIDSEGNTTDKLLIKCKLAVGGTRKDGTACSNRPPVLFGADHNPFIPDGSLGKGTKLRVSLGMKPYSQPKVGIRFDIVSAQIIDAEYHGIQASEDDFGAVEGSATTAAPATTVDTGSGGDDGGGFNF